MTDTAVTRSGPAASSECDRPDERDLTSDEDVEVDTLSAERMERLRELADRYSPAS